MSQIILDDHIDVREVLTVIRKWITAEVLHQLRPQERILDDRIPQILLTLKQPTFVTIDQGFWHPHWCNPKYCILCFVLTKDQQDLLPGLLRALLRQPEFRTRAGRMSKVAHVGTRDVEYWQFQKQDRQRIVWKTPRRKE